jgi:GDP-D-mannose dehydratase
LPNNIRNGEEGIKKALITGVTGQDGAYLAETVRSIVYAATPFEEGIRRAYEAYRAQTAQAQA